MKRFVVIAVLILMAYAGESLACQCLPRVECITGDGRACARARFDEARFVFFGKVIDRDLKTALTPAPIDMQPRPAGEPITVVVEPEVWRGGYNYIATVEVVTGWKRFRSERVFVVAEMADGANWGVDLKVGSTYLFFSHAKGNAYVASGCTVAGEETVTLLPKGRAIKRKDK